MIVVEVEMLSIYKPYRAVTSFRNSASRINYL